jgi:hypothetical protein
LKTGLTNIFTNLLSAVKLSFQQKKKEKKTAGNNVIVYDVNTLPGEKKG